MNDPQNVPINGGTGLFIAMLTIKMIITTMAQLQISTQCIDVCGMKNAKIQATGQAIAIASSVESKVYWPYDDADTTIKIGLIQFNKMPMTIKITSSWAIFNTDKSKLLSGILPLAISYLSQSL